MDEQGVIAPKLIVGSAREKAVSMSVDKPIKLTRAAKKLTAQQEADFLNTSPPYLIGLLEREEVNYTLVGIHRRIRVDDLLVYRETMMANTGVAMDELMKLSQELGVGY